MVLLAHGQTSNYINFKNMGTESLENLPAEREQTPEEIMEILEIALEQGRHVDLTIDDLAGNPMPTPDLIVEEFDGSYLAMTYLVEDGDVGELIPLKFTRIRKAVLR